MAEQNVIRRQAGFSLVELIVVLSIMMVLAGVLMPVVGERIEKSRDTRRLQDIQTVVRAIEGYLFDTGKLPDQDKESGSGGWDTTLDGTFITELVDAGYLHDHLSDPLNDKTHHYRYYHYPAGFQGFSADFYVVGILNFETDGFSGQTGQWKGTTRDWGKEFAYVVGGESR